MKLFPDWTGEGLDAGVHVNSDFTVLGLLLQFSLFSLHTLLVRLIFSKGLEFKKERKLFMEYLAIL